MYVYKYIYVYECVSMYICVCVYMTKTPSFDGHKLHTAYEMPFPSRRYTYEYYIIAATTHIRLLSMPAMTDAKTCVFTRNLNPASRAENRVSWKARAYFKK